MIKELKNKFPDIKGPIKEDICYATTNRQKAVKKIAPDCDMFFVLGSRNSSNSVRLVEVAKKAGCQETELMHFGKELPLEKIKKCLKIDILTYVKLIISNIAEFYLIVLTLKIIQL